MSGTIGDPPESRASKFTVVLDPPITLAVGGDIDHTFDFRLGPNVWTQEPVIVSFLLVRADDLQLQVTMNDLNYTRDYSPGPERSVHEVIGPAARNGANQLTLRVHRGSCRISDLIVWYQVSP
jgi:hypothetical protein